MMAIATRQNAVPSQIPPEATWTDNSQFFGLTLSFFISLSLNSNQILIQQESTL
jgi:hypothetical protein